MECRHWKPFLRSQLRQTKTLAPGFFHARPKTSWSARVSTCLYALLNAGARINRLPAELLVEIMTQVQNTDVYDWYDDWYDALLVCRHWFVVGSMAGRLWKSLKVKHCTNLLRTGLARSRDAELDLKIVCHDHQRFLDTIRLIALHIPRLGSLSIYHMQDKNVPAFASFMESAMPALHRVRVEALPRGNAEKLVLDFPPERFPRLEAIHIRRIHTFGNLAVVSQLRFINITAGFGSKPDLTAATFLNALRCMENVEELILTDVKVCDLGRWGPPACWDRVALSKLRKLVVQMEGSLIKQMLFVVVIPADAIVHLKIILVDEDLVGTTASIAAALPQDSPRCLPILSRIIKGHIVISTSYHYVCGFIAPPSSTRGLGDIALQLKPSHTFAEDATAGPNDLVDVFRGAPLESLTIEAPPALAVRTDWRNLFALYPTLRRLNLTVHDDQWGPRTPVDVILLALDPGDGTRLDAGPHADLVLCPELRCLCLNGLWMDSLDIVDMVATCLENRRLLLPGRPDGRVLEELVLRLKDRVPTGYLEEAFDKRVAPFVDVLKYPSPANIL